MGRVLGIDFGQKRCGLAVTDPLQIIVTGLETVDTSGIFEYLENYMTRENVEKIVIGLPVHKDGNFTYIKPDIDKLAQKIAQKWPEMVIDFGDEQFSSVHARKIIFDSGIKKQKRQDKALLDKVSAVVILQRYLKHI
jgi:putative Holliday junction resolvase